jgi:formamidopyrimidine-DNA glycosylase
LAVQTPSVVRPFHRNRPELAKALEGAKIVAARRRGHVIFLDLDGDHTWVIDTGAEGSVHRETASEEPGEDTHLAVSFTIGGALHLSEPGGDTTIRTGVVPTEEALEAAGIAPDALDPLEDNPTWMEFGRFLQDADAPLKQVLIDRTLVVGIGDVYSDEILWEAGLRHDRSSASLSTQEVRRLYRGMQEVVYTAMKQRGSSLDDQEVEGMVDEDGEVAEHLRVYGREGLPCLRCRQPIKRTRIRKGLYTYHCEQCMI